MSTPTLLARLGITTPIIQAPMAGTSTPALAAAVSNAGGLGSLGLAAMNAETARKAIRDTRALTDRPFNVNLFCHQSLEANLVAELAWLDWLAPTFAQFGATPPASLREIYLSLLVDTDMQRMLVEEKPAVVSFHFGLPSANLIAELKQAGIVLLASATSLDEARQAVQAGMDAVIAQGIEAGGHRGIFDPEGGDDQLGTFALTRLLASQLPVPVIAAGGIMDGAGIVAALALGAQAAQLGTAFVACPESSADAAYREVLLSKAAHTTTITKAISGRPARALRNRFTALGEDPAAPQVPTYPNTYDAGKALNLAAKAKGETGYGAQWAGQAAALARQMPAADLVARLRQEIQDSLQQLQILRG